MKNFIIIIAFFILLALIACENEDISKTKNPIIANSSSTISSSLIEKETNYFPAIDKFLINKIGNQYSKGEFCIPSYKIVAVDEKNSNDILVWGDFWVFNYNLVGNILETISGGSHPGLMHIKQTDNSFEVISFDQVDDGTNNLSSAKKIFGDKYNKFHFINSDEKYREQIRAKSISRYVKKYNISATMYKDYGWPTKDIPFEENN